MCLTKIFILTFALVERLPTFATLPHLSSDLLCPQDQAHLVQPRSIGRDQLHPVHHSSQAPPLSLRHFSFHFIGSDNEANFINFSHFSDSSISSSPSEIALLKRALA